MSGRRRGVMVQAARVLALRDLLGGRRMPTPVADLAGRFGVSERQIRRDLDAIESAGTPIDRLLVDGHSAVRLVGGPRAVMLTRRERFSLVAARCVLGTLRGTSFADDLDSVYAKLAATGTAAERAELAAIARAFACVPDSEVTPPPDPDVFDALQTGVLDHRLVDFEYRDHRGRPTRGTLAPYALVAHGNGLYVVGRHDPEDGVLRTWAAERFGGAAFRRGTRFAIPDGLDAAQLFARTVGKRIG